MLPARGATFYAYRKRINSTFQSTLPARGATARDDIMHYLQTFQSTLPARGATLLTRQSAGASVISIHAPRTGSDLPPSSAWNPNNLFQSTLPARGATTSRMRKNCYFLFQSTLPARGATRQMADVPQLQGISIHAPRTGSDFWKTQRRNWRKNFNPRSPHGERRSSDSTLPLASRISIHAPRTGSDRVQRGDVVCFAQFQSTLPARGATESA